MSYTNIQPIEVSFETKQNNIIKKHIRKAFLTSIILNKADIEHGYIELYNKHYTLYLSYELSEIVEIDKFDRVLAFASFQEHTNDATVVLCKAFSNVNVRKQAFTKAECKRKLIELFNTESEG